MGDMYIPVDEAAGSANQPRVLAGPKGSIILKVPPYLGVALAEGAAEVVTLVVEAAAVVAAADVAALAVEVLTVVAAVVLGEVVLELQPASRTTTLNNTRMKTAIFLIDPS